MKHTNKKVITAINFSTFEFVTEFCTKFSKLHMQAKKLLLYIIIFQFLTVHLSFNNRNMFLYFNNKQCLNLYNFQKLFLQLLACLL